jgi:HSP20 family molecular chaperone IbpA
MLDSVFGPQAPWNARQPRVDVIEETNGYVLEAELPGFGEDEVDVRVEDNLLTVTAGRKESADDVQSAGGTDKTYLMRERCRGEYRRSFVLPKDADRSAIEARFRNGVLILNISKVPEATPRQIKIQGE